MLQKYCDAFEKAEKHLKDAELFVGRMGSVDEHESRTLRGLLIPPIRVIILIT